ncbi:MAG: hypothetical protein J5586_08750 [Clostridia bacterium]|nr:hypothetical protein [Clostridia bacterium]
MFEETFRALCEKAAAGIKTYGTDFEKDRKFAVFTMLRSLVKLELVFKRNSLGQVTNVLFCRIYPNKNSELYYLMPEVFVELGVNEFRSTFFSMIENEERLRACFGALWGIVTEYLPEIEAAAADGRLPWSREVKEDDYLERRLMFPEYGTLSREPFVISDYTKGPAYRALLNGDAQKTIKLIEKARAKGKTLEYQNRLCDFLKERGGDFSPMPDECNALRDDDASAKREIPKYLLVLLSLFAALFVVFLAAKLIFDRIFSAGTVLYLTAPWYMCLLLAALPAGFGAIFLRKKLMTLFFPKTGRRYAERDEMKNSKTVDKFAGAAFAAAVGFAIGVFIMVGAASERVYADRLDCCTEESVFKREEFAFADIEEICHISARYNDYGDRIERGSYVLVMKDGRQHDLDGAMSEKETEEKFLPLVRDCGIPVRSLDSDRDLP